MFRKPLLASVVALSFATPALAQGDGGWSGPYVGVNLGIAGGKTDYPASAVFEGSPTPTPTATAAAVANSVAGTATLNSSGVIGGAQVGYDLQLGNVVIGAVADIAASGIDGKVEISGASNLSGLTGSARAHVGSKLDYLGTVRARAGMPIGSFMPYVTGGLAYGRLKSSAALDFSGSSGMDSGSDSLSIEEKTNHTGWTAGAGAEYAVTSNVYFGVEYLHAELGKKRIVGGSIDIFDGSVDAELNVKPKLDIVRAILNYRF